MSVITAYSPEFKYDSAAPLTQGEPDIESLEKRMRDRPDTEASGKYILDALSPSVWQGPRQTFLSGSSVSGYRWRGEDTLTWGSPDEWLQIKLLQGLVATLHQDAWLKQYPALQEIVLNTRVHRLEGIYRFRDSPTVRSFLQTHPHLVDVLFEAYPYLLKHFGPDVQIALEFVKDPEVEDWDELFAYIITPLPVDEALARLDRLDEEWFLDQLDRVGDLFNFNLECI